MNKMMKKKGAAIILSLLLAVLFLSPQLVSGAAIPVTRLLALSNQSYPASIVSDNYGNFFVTDSYNKRVYIFDSRGNRQSRYIDLQYTPTSLAISPDNLLYVGENRDPQNNSNNGYLEVFTTQGLPKSAQIVNTPKSIAFLSTGEIFIVDKVQVNMFNANLEKMTFNPAGTFIRPRSLAIWEVKDPETKLTDMSQSELFILDEGNSATVGGYSSTPVWRIQIFNLATGALKRTFSSFTWGQEGKIGSASSIALDNSTGMLFVSDNEQGVTNIYDASGSYMTWIRSMTDPVTIKPVNISFNNNRLYMADYPLVGAKGNVFVFGIGSYAVIGTDAGNMAFSYQKDVNNNTLSRTLNIGNSGSGTLTWNAKIDADWLSLDTLSGQVAGGDNQTINVNIVNEAAAGLSAGTYTGNIQLLSNGGTENITVTLTVLPAPGLTVTPDTFNISRKSDEKTGPLSVIIKISNNDSGSLMWRAVSDSPWLSLSPVRGNNNSVPSPVISISDNVAPGKYTGYITLSLEETTASPATITVNLEVISVGTIKVSTNTPGAAFTVTGPAGSSHTGSGTDYTFTNLTEGAYTITYAPLKGYKVPVSSTQMLTTGGELTFTGNYVNIMKQVNILATHGPGVKANSEIAVFNSDGTPVLDAASAPFVIAPFSYTYGAGTAVGNFDGYSMGIIAGEGRGATGVNTFAMGFAADGTPMAGMPFSPSRYKYGVSVAAGDFDGDGKDEIITGTSIASSEVKVYSYSNGVVGNTGIYFLAYLTSAATGKFNGVNIAAADIDGDGIDELITTPANTNVIPQVRIFRVKTSDGPGKWTVEEMNSFNACENVSGTQMTTGDIDADGVPEVLVVCLRAGGSAEVREYRANGEYIRSLDTGDALLSYIAAGDTNMDGAAEIILGDGPSDNRGKIRIVDAVDGSTIKLFQAFPNSFGVRVSVGDLGY